MNNIHQEKCQALVSWVNAICTNDGNTRIETPEDLRDGSVFVDLLLISEEELKFDNRSSTCASRWQLVRTYLESFYSNIFDSTSQVINFASIIDPPHSQDLLIWEIVKVLLALLSALIQENKTDKFVQCAKSLSATDQVHIMECLQSMVCRNVSTPLEEDFADILKASTTIGNVNSEDCITVSTPKTPRQLPFRQKASNRSIFDTSVVMHNSSLNDFNTPASPIEVLMLSPVVSQKTIIRQLNKEIKKLKVQVSDEIHFKEELELDIQEKAKEITRKDCKISELERMVDEQKKYRDMVDELESVRNECDKLKRELERTRTKLRALQDEKKQILTLQKTIGTLSTENARLQDLENEMEKEKSRHKKYRTEHYMQILKIDELERALNAKDKEIKRYQGEVTDLRDSLEHIKQQRNILKKEKEDLEESVSSGDSNTGENMGIISDIKIKDLEEELKTLKESWVKPSVHESLKRKLQEVIIMKETLEGKYFEKQQEQYTNQGKLDQAECKVKLLDEKQTHYENELKDKENKLRSSMLEIEKLQNSILKLQSSEKRKEVDIQEMRSRLTAVEADLSRSQAKYHLCMKEIENHKTATESRRLTLTGTLEKVMLERNSLIQQMENEKSHFLREIQEMESKLYKQTSEATEVEEELKHSLQEADNSIVQTRNMYESDRIAKENVIVKLKEEMKVVKEELSDTERRFDQHLSAFMHEKESLKTKYEQEKTMLTQKCNKLMLDADMSKKSSKTRIDELTSEVHRLKQEILTLQSKLDRVQCQINDQDQLWEGKHKNMKDKHCQEIERLSSNQLNMTKQLTALTKDRDICSAKLKQAETELKTEREKVQTMEIRIGELEEQEKLQNEKHVSVETSISGLEKALKESREKVQQVDKEKRTLELEASHLQLRYKDTLDQLNYATTEINRKEKEEEIMTEDLKKLQSLVCSLEVRIAEQDVQYNKLETGQLDLNNLLASKEHCLLEKNNENEKLMKVNNEISMKIEFLQSSLEKAESDLKLSLTKCDMLAKDVEKYKYELKLSKEEVKKCGQDINVNQEEFKSKIAELQEKLNVLEGQKSSLKAQSTDMKKLEMENTVLIGKVNELEKEKNSFKNRMTDLEKEKEILIKERDNMKSADEETTHQLQKQLEAANKRQELMISQNQEYSSKMTEKGIELDTTKKLLESYKVYYEEKKQIIQKLTKEIKGLMEENQQLEALKKENQQLEELKEENQQLEALRAEKLEQEKKVKCLSNQLRSMEVQLDHSNNQIRDLQKKLDNTGTIYLGDGEEFRQMKTSTDRFNKSLADSLDDSMRQCNNLDDSIFSASPAEVKKKTDPSRLESQQAVQEDKIDRRQSLRLPAKPIHPANPFSRSLGYRDSSLAGTPFSLRQAPWEQSPFDSKRASELLRRNTLCLPHLRDSYITETQTAEANRIPETEFKTTLPLRSSTKRKLIDVQGEELEPDRKQVAYPYARIFTTPQSSPRYRKRSSSSPRIPISRTKLKSSSKAPDKENTVSIKKSESNLKLHMSHMIEDFQVTESIGRTPKTKHTSEYPISASKVGKLISLFNKKSESTPIQKKKTSPKRKPKKVDLPNTPKSRVTGGRNGKPIKTPIKPKSHLVAKVLTFQNSPSTPIKKPPHQYITESFRALKNVTPIKSMGVIVKSISTPIKKSYQNKIHPL